LSGEVAGGGDGDAAAAARGGDDVGGSGSSKLSELPALGATSSARCGALVLVRGKGSAVDAAAAVTAATTDGAISSSAATVASICSSRSAHSRPVMAPPPPQRPLAFATAAAGVGRCSATALRSMSARARAADAARRASRAAVPIAAPGVGGAAVRDTGSNSSRFSDDDVLPSNADEGAVRNDAIAEWDSAGVESPNVRARSPACDGGAVGGGGGAGACSTKFSGKMPRFPATFCP
jgi:hypothetical protein